MKKIRKANLNLYMIIITASIFLFGVVFGSIYDLNFSKAIYHPYNFVSYYVEYLGTLPAGIIFSLSGVMLFLYFKHNTKIKGSIILKYLSLILVIIAGIIWGYDSLNNYLPKTIFSILIGIAVISPFSYLFYLDLKRKYSNDFLRYALIIILAFTISFILTFGLKYLIARPRYYYLNNENRFDLFRNWYAFSTDKSIYPNVKDKSYLQSWPSGHATFSGLNYLLLIFPFIKKNKINKHLIFSSVTIYSLLVMAGRLLDGHHYLSDVSFGYLLGTLCSFLFMIFLFPKNDTNNKSKLNLTKGINIS